jgi:hypothetical protein
MRGQAETHGEQSYGLRQTGRIEVRDDDMLASDSRMSGPDREEELLRRLDDQDY